MKFGFYMLLASISFLNISRANVSCKNIKTENDVRLAVEGTKLTLNNIEVTGSEYKIPTDFTDRPDVTIKRDSSNRPVLIVFDVKKLRDQIPVISYELTYDSGKCELKREIIYGNLIKYDREICGPLSKIFKEFDSEVKRCDQTLQRLSEKIEPYRKKLKSQNLDLYYFALANYSQGEVSVGEVYQNTILQAAACTRPTAQGEPSRIAVEPAGKSKIKPIVPTVVN